MQEDDIARSVQHDVTAKLTEIRTGPGRQASAQKLTGVGLHGLTIEEPKKRAAA